MCYLNGEGVEENEEKAEFWLKKSIENGKAGAMELLKQYKSDWQQRGKLYGTE